MPVRVAVLDANVLYSIEHTDILLTLAAMRAVRVHWSSEILDEVRRNLAARPDLSTAAIDYRIAQMNRALPDALDDPPGDLVGSMPINDKDRHVLALAVHVEAAVIVTSNLRDFPARDCEPYGVEAVSPDEFLAGIAEADPSTVRDVVAAVAARRQRPPITTDELLDRLSNTLPEFVDRLRAAREDR